jgi:RalA-binding protein 1
MAHPLPQHQPSIYHSASLPSLASAIHSFRHDSTPAHDLPPAAADDAHHRRRKPAPSPLSPTATARAAYQHSPYHDSPRFDEPRSPREKLDALLAEEDHHSSPIRPTKPAHPPTPPNVPTTTTATTTTATQPARPSAYAKLRQVSSPTLSSAGISPPASPVVMSPQSRPNRPETTTPAVPVRNPSIDSAASSLSSSASQNRAPAGHAPRPSQDTSTANPPDMAALIASAGSPEAAMMALWKEKQNTSNHNAQLWRLVEKQRAMIIGLQKDLERALKDKDRYRRKFKEYVEQVPPGPGSLQKSDTFNSMIEREPSESPITSERPDESAKPSDAKTGEYKTSPLTQEHPAPRLIPDSQLATSPSHSIASNPTSIVNSPTDYSVQPLSVGSKGLGLDSTVLQSTHAPQPSVQAPNPTTPPQNASDATLVPGSSNLQAPEISLIQATPVIGGDGFEGSPRKPAQPLRKAPPAPLNLSKPVTTSAHLHQLLSISPNP